jgi:teichuronic acid biosynthesis glycosyltransferase TuaC
LAGPGNAGGSKPLRVLAIIPGSEQGTSFIFAKRQMAKIRDLGVDVRFFWLGERLSPMGLLSEWNRLKRVIADVDPDVVHAHYGTVTALVSALTGRRPFVITFRGSDLNGSRAVSPLRSTLGVLMSEIAALAASGIVCVSRRLGERLWWRKDRVQVIPSGVDESVFRPIPLVEARGALGWTLEERVILFHGARDATNARVKRLDLARAATAVAQRLAPGARLEILDGGVDADAIAVYMNAADCLLLTSDTEGSPNVIKEALACDLPIVSVDVGDVPERVSGVEPGGIVERDPERLGAAIAEVLEKRLRSNGHEAIREITTRRVAERIMDVYQRVAGRP